MKLNMLKGAIFGVFQELYQGMPDIALAKYEMYSLIKLVVYFYCKKYIQIYEKARTFTKGTLHDKYEMIKKNISLSKIEKIRDKINEKIQDDITDRELKTEGGTNESFKRKIQKMNEDFPEIKSEFIDDEMASFKRLVKNLASKIVQHPISFMFVAECLIYMQDGEDLPFIREAREKLREDPDRSEEIYLSAAIKLPKQIQDELQSLAQFQVGRTDE